jgi:hypothetical protein
LVLNSHKKAQKAQKIKHTAGISSQQFLVVRKPVLVLPFALFCGYYCAWQSLLSTPILKGISQNSIQIWF